MIDGNHDPLYPALITLDVVAIDTLRHPPEPMDAEATTTPPLVMAEDLLWLAHPDELGGRGSWVCERGPSTDIWSLLCELPKSSLGGMAVVLKN